MLIKRFENCYLSIIQAAKLLSLSLSPASHTSWKQEQMSWMLDPNSRLVASKQKHRVIQCSTHSDLLNRLYLSAKRDHCLNNEHSLKWNLERVENVNKYISIQSHSYQFSTHRWTYMYMSKIDSGWGIHTNLRDVAMYECIVRYIHGMRECVSEIARWVSGWVSDGGRE